MKPIKTKAEIRAELDREIAQYLSSGGEVHEIPPGTSGNQDNRNLFAHSTTFEPRQERTPVGEIIKQVDSRRKHKSPTFKRHSGPKKRLITDDFGEPVRWVWQE